MSRRKNRVPVEETGVEKKPIDEDTSKGSVDTYLSNINSTTNPLKNQEKKKEKYCETCNIISNKLSITYLLLYLFQTVHVQHQSSS